MRNLYLKCPKCGLITRMLERSVYQNKVFCRCGTNLQSTDKVTKEAWKKQHTINTRDPNEAEGVPRGKVGVPLSTNEMKKTDSTTLL